MLADMKDSLRAAWLRATRSDIEVPLTGYAQTKLSWARRVDSFDDLPDVYRDRTVKDWVGVAKSYLDN